MLNLPSVISQHSVNFKWCEKTTNPGVVYSASGVSSEVKWYNCNMIP